MTPHALPPVGSAASSTGWHWLTPAAEMAAAASRNWPPQPHSPAPGVRCSPRVALRALPVDGRSVRAARDFTITTLRQWDAADRHYEIATVVSELLTNALRHAFPRCCDSRPRWPIRLGLLQHGTCVVCAVADPSQRPPVQKDPGSHAETGRGLHVIGALADTWGYTTPSETGKTVWAIFSIKPRPPYPSP
jgi:hypothetical protein